MKTVIPGHFIKNRSIQDSPAVTGLPLSLKNIYGV